MSTSQPLFAESIPADYDRYLGPFLFEAYAKDLARRLEVGPGGAILETACGTGIASEFLRRHTKPEVSILATDLSEPMLARAISRRGQLQGLEFQQADALDLPFDDMAFDAVVQQFGLMFVPDKLQAMGEALRVLRPGGQLVFNVWDSLSTNPYVQVAQDAIAGFFDEHPPEFLYLPWSYHDHGSIRDLLTEAGFTNIEMQTVSQTVERPSAREVAIGLVRGNPTIHAVRERARGTTEEVVEAVTEALGQTFGQAPLRAPMQAIVVTAKRAGE